MSKNEVYAKRLKQLAGVELDNAIKLDKDFRGLGNEVLRQIIDSTAIDSRKHAGLFNACAAILEGRNLAITDVEYEQLEKSLQTHIRIENEMVKNVEEMIREIKDDRIKLMLNHIRDDEYRHHELMANLNEAVLKRQVQLEKDVWDQLFRDALTHGHPQGQWEEP
jgi:hypothetical protein